MLVRTLAKRSEFLAANRGLRFPVPGFVLLVRKRDDGNDQLGIGYTVSKKIGNAVTRNRMKRRMRALVHDIFPNNGIAGCDHVLIGRPGGNDIAFTDLGDQLSSALRRAAKKLEQGITVDSRPHHGGKRKSGGSTPAGDSQNSENRHRPRAVPRDRKAKIKADAAVLSSPDSGATLPQPSPPPPAAIGREKG